MQSRARQFLSFFLLVGLVGVSFLGVYAMSHDGDNHDGCFASIANQGDCPNTGLDPIGSLAFHLGVWKQFSQSVDSLSVFAWSLFLILSALALVLKYLANWFSPNPGLLPSLGFFDWQLAGARSQSAWHSWWSLHEHSPTNL